MIVGELERALDEAIPFAWAEDWDNVGLLVGDRSAPVRGATVALDPSIEAMKTALDRSCSVLITHHPLIFHPLKRIDCAEGPGAQIAFAIRNGLSLFALHTNWDVSPCGVNAAIAQALSLKEVRPLLPSTGGAWGSGAAGQLPRSLNFMECGAAIRDALHLSRLELHGDPEKMVSTLALCGGSGGAFWREAAACGAEGYFTADMRYHERLDALDKEVSLFIADHGEMERFSLAALAETVSKATGEKAILLDVSRPAFCMI